MRAKGRPKRIPDQRQLDRLKGAEAGMNTFLNLHFNYF